MVGTRKGAPSSVSLSEGSEASSSALSSKKQTGWSLKQGLPHLMNEWVDAVSDRRN